MKEVQSALAHGFLRVIEVFNASKNVFPEEPLGFKVEDLNVDLIAPENFVDVFGKDIGNVSKVPRLVYILAKKFGFLVWIYFK